VSTETSLELIPCDDVDVPMIVALHLPPIGCRGKELVYGK
jgi:hypothetical protein